ncbi:general odorant-binding protein 56h-like [Episyrphus balteatus]|uniref:general odorant-binding protein 56h-like n=1 Tax=Episyrphus balteatus TaxID=286459 RepID=UPI002485B14F|nr:general odorant-binding protein 56h-like [Episyrphus balteatus]
MKYLIVVILAAICGSALCGMADWQENQKQCCDKHNVKLKDAIDAVHGRTKEADLTPDMKCFFLCMGEKQNIIKDGIFQAQVFKDALSGIADKDMVAKVTEECNIKGTDDCDTGYKVATCMARNNVKKQM